MTSTKLRHIALLTGIILIFVSFLFFARKMAFYQVCLMSGLIISGISFLIILKKDKAKSKLIWIGIVIILAVVQYLSEPILIDTSYKIYYFNNKEKLNYLTSIPGNLTVMSDTIIFDSTSSQIDKGKLIKIYEDLNCTYIFKGDNSMYVELWGRLDIRHGLLYTIDKKRADNRKRIVNNWYH